jgi:hypothetical protein
VEIEDEVKINKKYKIWKELITTDNKDHKLDLNQWKKSDLYDNIYLINNIFSYNYVKILLIINNY